MDLWGFLSWVTQPKPPFSSSNSNLRQFQHPSCLALVCTAHTVCLSHLQPVPCQINSNQIKYFQFIRSLCLHSTTCLIRLGSLFRWFRGSVCLLVASKLYCAAHTTWLPMVQHPSLNSHDVADTHLILILSLIDPRHSPQTDLLRKETSSCRLVKEPGYWFLTSHKLQATSYKLRK